LTREWLTCRLIEVASGLETSREALIVSAGGDVWTVGFRPGSLRSILSRAEVWAEAAATSDPPIWRWWVYGQTGTAPGPLEAVEAVQVAVKTMPPQAWSSIEPDRRSQHE
jgi:hypothetical protein